MSEQASTNPNPERSRVMIVDDDAEMRALLHDALECDGFLVREHPAGDGLLPLVANWRPDAIVLDKEMAGSSGLDLLTDIRRCHPDMPVVIVTAFGGPELQVEALRLGAAHYMDKPFRVSRLLDVLRAVVGHCSSATHASCDAPGGVS